MSSAVASDWGEISPQFDEIAKFLNSRDITTGNEAKTRFDVIDRIIKDVLGWRHGQIEVEERCDSKDELYVDYVLRSGDATVVIEAKKIGAAFPNPTRKKQLKLNGVVLGSGEIAAAINKSNVYAQEKKADVVIVTNGLCWCAYPFEGLNDNTHATLFFPFSFANDAEALFNQFAEIKVEAGSLRNLTHEPVRTEDRLLSITTDSDGRVDRNNIADYIVPALNSALYADALLTNPDSLEKCFVRTEARVKFDSYLGMHLADPKPVSIHPAKRIRKDKNFDHLDQIVDEAITSYAPPVTLIIGSVGAGKSIYLKHFELISGRDLLTSKKAHWINIDFEKMGPEGKPREFVYSQLRDYLNAQHPDNPTDYKHVVEPAYADEIAALARGPLAPIFTQKAKFYERVSDHIRAEYDAVEPYVDKVIRYLTSKPLVILVLDNIDLYEDEELERSVFAEGLALSKRTLCNVFVSVRETTYVKHSTDATFDAYELRKLWLDAPPFKEVLSTRLTYSKKILEKKSARIHMFGGITLEVHDLSDFFDIVQSSILKGDAGDFIEKIADSNIRKGLKLVNNFLTSGHIQADRALNSFLKGDRTYRFPFHEIFKGAMLGQWKHYREGRAECINIFDARLGSKQLRLLRLHLLALLFSCARREDSIEVPVSHCVNVLSPIGSSESQIIQALTVLLRNGLIRTTTAQDISATSTVVLTRSGGYYIHTLASTFSYVEAALIDTAIEDADVWQDLSTMTIGVERARNMVQRMELRVTRIDRFLKYLTDLEATILSTVGQRNELTVLPRLAKGVEGDTRRALYNTRKYYSS
jgi:hypothetical protein